jgi:hypothetical protein
MFSARKSNTELTKFLIESGAEVNAQSECGETAFIEAANRQLTLTIFFAF